MNEGKIHEALAGRRDYKTGGDSDGSKKKMPTHTHGMRIERGASGGHVVHTTIHHGEGPHSEGHSHEEGPHAVADNKSLQAMIDEHMGDQPAAGEMPAPGEEQNPTDQETAAGPTQAA